MSSEIMLFVMPLFLKTKWNSCALTISTNGIQKVSQFAVSLVALQVIKKLEESWVIELKLSPPLSSLIKSGLMVALIRVSGLVLVLMVNTLDGCIPSN